MKSKKNYITKGFTLLLSLLCMLSLWTIPIKAEEKVDFTWEPEQPVIGETITLHGPETTYYGSDFEVWHWYLYNTVGNSPDFQGKDAEITLNKEHNEITLHCYDSEGSLLSVTKEIIAKKGRASASLSSTNGKFENYRNQFDSYAYILSAHFQPRGETIENVIFKVDDIEIYKQEEAFVDYLFQLPIPKDTLNALEIGEHPVSVSSTGNNDYWGFDTYLTSVYVYGVTGVDIVTPPTVMIKGEQEQLQASVDVYEDKDFLVDQSVEWKVENNTSSDTSIINGLLSIGLDESASSLKVTATSTFDTSISDAIEIQVVDQTHDVKPGSSTQIKDGENGSWEFTGNYQELVGISLDGKAFRIEPINKTSANLYMNDYTDIAGKIEEGSVKITLYKEFLKTLTKGSHAIEVKFLSNDMLSYGETSFEVDFKNEPEQPKQEVIKPKDTTSKEEKTIEKEKPVKDTASSQTQSASFVLFSFMSIACMMYLMNKDRKKL